MELALAQKELIRRCYRWSLQVAEQQARTDYPLLRPLSKSNPGMLGFLAGVESLDTNQRLLLAQALVKSFYFKIPKEVNIEDLLSDQFAPEERQCAEAFYQHWGQVSISLRPFPLPKDCVPTKAKKLTRAVISHLSAVLQIDFVREEAFNWRNTVWVDGWEFITEFYFSGKGIECGHWLVRRDDPQAVVTQVYEQYLARTRQLDFVMRLGIGSTWWVVGCEQDVPAVLDSIAAICTQVSEQVPLLVKGLGIND